MIVTITMNPALDKSTSTEKLVPEKKLRCTNMLTEAGGGGINVSKAIHELGGTSLAVFPAGGMNGKILQHYLEEKKISFRIIPISNDTRENVVVRETSTNAQYRFVMPGPVLSEKEVNECFQILDEIKPEFIVASGSLPPGIPENFFEQLALHSRKINAKCIIDTSGSPLQLAAKEGVYLLKPNLTELCSLSGKSFLELNEVNIAAREVLKSRACEIMVVSMGPSGALLITKDHEWRIPAPVVKKESTVGAGDSMVAGMVWMLQQNKTLLETVQFGVACGTAATMNPGTQLFKKEDVSRLYQWIQEHTPKS